MAKSTYEKRYAWFANQDNATLEFFQNRTDYSSLEDPEAVFRVSQSDEGIVLKNDCDDEIVLTPEMIEGAEFNVDRNHVRFPYGDTDLVICFWIPVLSSVAEIANA